MSNPLIEELEETGAIPHVDIAFPTRGAFYPDGEIIDCNPMEVSVGPLSVLNESAFQDPMMLISGRAVSKMIRHITNGIIDPGRLCEIDVQTILIACRIASYGPTLKLEHKCGKCNESNTIELDLNEHLMNYSPFTDDEMALFNITLPKSNQKVNLRPIPYEDAVDMTMGIIKTSIGFEQLQHIEGEDTLTEAFIDAYKDQFDKTLETNIGALVSSIYYVTTAKSGNVVHDRDMIEQWVTKLSMEDVKAIRDRIKELSDRVLERSKVTYQCQKCGEENTLYVELDPQKLFTVAENSETVTNSSAESKNIEKVTKKPSRVSRR